MNERQQYDQEYYQKNKERILQQKRIYRTTEAHRLNSLKRYKNNPEKFIKYQKTLRQENPEKHMLLRTRAGAKQRKIEHTISIQDISIPKLCPLLEIPLIISQDRATDNSPSLDRIDNSKGYIPGNVWVISNRANQIKRDASLEELQLLIKNLGEHNKNRS